MRKLGYFNLIYGLLGLIASAVLLLAPAEFVILPKAAIYMGLGSSTYTIVIGVLMIRYGVVMNGWIKKAINYAYSGVKAPFAKKARNDNRA